VFAVSKIRLSASLIVSISVRILLIVVADTDVKH
jgi:hypothetical protein